MKVTRKVLTDGVELVAVSTQQFKTSMLGVTLAAPLDAATATGNALVGDVLYRGSEGHPDMEALSAAEDELYGLSIYPTVRQRGESQCVSLTGSFIDDKYALDGRPVLEPAAELLGEVLLRPVTEDGVFRADYVKSEGANLADQIAAQVNDKRRWAVYRATQVMCQGEAYAVDKYGFADEARSMDPRTLWARYQALLSQSRVIFYYSGSAPLERVEGAVRAAFGPLLTPRPEAATPCQVVEAPKGPVREQTDRLDVSQGKLALGFRTGGIDLHHPQFPALLVCNALYGGTASSKLFLNVREKLSLCYFASSMLDKLKGLMLVCSGVEFADFQVAREAILAQLEEVRSGAFTPEELEAAKRLTVSSLRTIGDSQGRMEDYWLTQTVADERQTPAELAEQIESVTGEQVTAAAEKLRLDTVYYLAGSEG